MRKGSSSSRPAPQGNASCSSNSSPLTRNPSLRSFCFPPSCWTWTPATSPPSPSCYPTSNRPDSASPPSAIKPCASRPYPHRSSSTASKISWPTLSIASHGETRASSATATPTNPLPFKWPANTHAAKTSHPSSLILPGCSPIFWPAKSPIAPLRANRRSSPTP